MSTALWILLATLPIAAVLGITLGEPSDFDGDDQ